MDIDGGPRGVRYPAPLRAGDVIGVTAPSSGVGDDLRPRLEFCVRTLEDRGFHVRVGETVGVGGVRSGPAEVRARELEAMLLDPEVKAIVPPWGGELAIELLPLLDMAAIRGVAPTWVIGYSDISTLLLPLTICAGMATVHAPNLMDTPFDVPSPLVHWLDVVTAPSGISFEQGPSGRRRNATHTNFRDAPTITDWEIDEPAGWSTIHGGPVEVSGRLLGGCLETISMLAGSRFGDVPGFARANGDDGVILYLEVAEVDALGAARMLHHLVLVGWMEAASAVLVGRPAGPDANGYTHHDAVVDSLGGLGIPVVCGVDVGHVPPQGVLVNGALAELLFDGRAGLLVQRLA